MDELRRAAGLPADATPSEPEGDAAVDESALYTSESGFLNSLRRLFNPLLKLLINPKAIVDALNAQSRKTNALAAQEAERRRRQTEWNGLHFEILRRLVTDIARVEIDNQHLAHRVESLRARRQFNERRVPASRAPPSTGRDRLADLKRAQSLLRHLRHRAEKKALRPITPRRPRPRLKEAGAGDADGAAVDRVSPATSPARQRQGWRFPVRWIESDRAARETISTERQPRTILVMTSLW